MLDILFWVSVFTGGLMVLLLLISIIGGLDLELDVGGGESDLDVNSGGLGVLKSALTLVSISTWFTRIFLIANKSKSVSVIGGIIVGIVAVYLLSKLLRLLLKQTEFNTWEMEDVLFLEGKVYLKIPNDGRMGIVQVSINGAIKELKAFTKDPVEIPTGTAIFVVDIEKDRIEVSINKD